MGRTTFYPNPKRLEKLSREEQLELFFDLISAVSFVRNPIETATLLQDLLTAKEVKNLARRLRIAKLLLSSKTQQEIVNSLHCSFATVTKVSVWLAQGGEGLRGVIVKLPQRYKMPPKLPPGPIEYYLPQVIHGLVQYTLATHQTKQLEKFLEKVGEKSLIDKTLQKAFDEEFKNRTKRKK